MTNFVVPHDAARALEAADRYEQPLIEMLLAALPTSRQRLVALDLACGNGTAALAMAARLPDGSRIVAISEDRRRLNALQGRLDARLRRCIFPRRQSRLRLPFAPGAFDLVYASLALEQFIPAQAYLVQALRVLRPDGRILIAMPLRDSCVELVRAFAAILAKRLPEDRWRSVVTESGHLEDLAAWTSALERAHVSEVEITRRTVSIEITVPLSQDPLFANVLLPMWIGNDLTRQFEALELLDRHVTAPMSVPHHLVCLTGRATRTAPELTLQQ